MTMKRIGLILLLVLPLMAYKAHKYYVSLCEVEYVQEQESIQIIVGFFIDDMELTLNKDHDTVMYLDTTREIQDVDNYYVNYLENNLEFHVNNSPVTYDFIGKEYDLDVVRFYLEITGVKELKSLEIRNSALFRDFPDQKNIIKIKVEDFHKTFYLVNGNDKGLLNF
jgi:hypothetical protein